MFTLSSIAWDGYARSAIIALPAFTQKLLFVLAFLILGSGFTKAQIYQTIADGNWSNNGFWTVMSPGTLVDPAETVYVSHNVITASNLNFQGVVYVDGNLTTAGNIDVSGQLIVTGQVLANRITIPMGGVLQNNGGSIATTNDITATSGMIDNCGDMSTGGNLIIDGGTLLNCPTGVICASGDIIISNFSQIMMDGFMGASGNLAVNSSFVFGCGLWNVGIDMNVTPDSWWDGCARVCVVGGIIDGGGNVIEDCPTVAAAGIAPPCGPGMILALKIDYFEAEAGSSEIELSWKAGDPLSGVDYIIERASGDLMFSEMTRVSSNEMLPDGSFNLSDTQPLNGLNHYRLRAIDPFGEETEKLSFAVIEVEYIPMNLNIYPNPLKGDQLHLDLGRSFEQNTQISIIDLAGSTVVRTTVPSSVSRSDISGMSNLSPGIYLVQVSNQVESQTLRLVIR